MLIGHNGNSRLRAETVFQSGAGRNTKMGTVRRPIAAEPAEQVTLSGRQGGFAPLRSLNGKALQQMASSAGLQAAQSAGLPAAVLQYFTPAEFLLLNSGDYHDAQHPINVANTVANLAGNAGKSSERVEFLQQVALLHDADERILLDGQGKFAYAEGAKPARVPVTLAFMDLNAEALSQRFGWKGTDLAEARALIAGTEHPLNNEPNEKRQYGLPEFDGKTSEAVFREALQALPQDRREVVAEEYQLLRFADQSANYAKSVEDSRSTIRGLSNEIGVPADILLKGSPAFLAGLGQDSVAFKDLPQATTRKLIAELGLSGSTHVYQPEELHGLFSAAESRAIEASKTGL